MHRKTTRINFLSIAIILGAVLMMPTLIDAVPESSSMAGIGKRPNFVVIMADDISWPAFGCMNPGAATKTPNIYNLAKQGMLFSNFHCSTALCMPARYKLYSGLLPPTSGATQNNHPSGTFKNVNNYLGELGYTVALAGKSHFRSKSFFKRIKGIDGNPNAVNPEWSLDGVKEFIGNAVAEKKNFCAFICPVNAHHPWTMGDPKRHPPASVTLMPHMVDTPKTRESMSVYMAEVEQFDQQVCDSLRLLKEMNLEENTVVIVLSEQGMEMPQGKYTVYDFGNRALCVVRWPGHVAAGSTTPAVSMYCDIVPTLVELAGGKQPEGIDGRSLRKILAGETKEHRKYAYCMYGIRRALAGDRYKLIWTPNGEDYSGPVTRRINKKKIFTQAWAEWVEAAKSDPDAKKKVDRVIKHPEYELYDTRNDPYELVNLASDPKHSETLKTMIADLKAEMASLKDTIINAESEESDDVK